MLAEYSPGFKRRGGIQPSELVCLLEGHGLLPYRIGSNGLEYLSRETLLSLERQTNILWTRMPLPNTR